MTIDEKNTIIQMRRAGKSMTEIAAATGISRNTVKSFCSRQGLTGAAETMPDITIPDTPAQTVCRFCGKPITQTVGKREKKFCSDSCRTRWWNAHLGENKRDGMEEYVCPNCDTTFFAYPNRKRKYCSHACYIEARFGGAVCD